MCWFPILCCFAVPSLQSPVASGLWAGSSLGWVFPSWEGKIGAPMQFPPPIGTSPGFPGSAGSLSHHNGCLHVPKHYRDSEMFIAELSTVSLIMNYIARLKWEKIIMGTYSNDCYRLILFTPSYSLWGKLD